MKNRDYLYPVDPIADLRELVNRSAEKYGDWPAYHIKNKPGGSYEPITYKEVRRDVSAYGTALMDEGLSGKKIAVIGESRYEWIITYMSVACIGSVIVPIDRELPSDEIAHLLERSEAAAIVYSAKVKRVVGEALELTGGIGKIIGMDVEEEEGNVLSLQCMLERGYRLLQEGRRDFFRVEINPDEMCALLFTSGTTGLAKGVMLSHRNLISNVVAMGQFVNVVGGTALSILPMHHTYEFTCDILGTFYQGCGVAICEGLKYIVKNLGECKANVLLGVPLVFEKMHRKIWKQAEDSGKAKMMRRAIKVSKKVGAQNLKATKKLFKAVHQAMGGEMRIAIAGGAAIEPSVIDDFRAMGLNMFQGYGMTENAPIIAVNKDFWSKPAAAGIPLPNTEVKIIDADEDGIGEIIYRGTSVMLGYYDNPEETAKVLKDGWLYSGDYGYFDSDGFLYVTGRKKNVIVTKNGKNVFPEEVEFYLLASPYVEEVLVWGKDEANGDTVICADVFPNFAEIKGKFGTIGADGIEKLLDKEIDEANSRMPAYKRVKRFYVREEEFEKTTTKKIKRHVVKHEG